jgi:hypothetical protein
MKFFTFNYALFGASILGQTQAQAENGSLGIIGRQGNRPTGSQKTSYRFLKAFRGYFCHGKEIFRLAEDRQILQSYF